MDYKKLVCGCEYKGFTYDILYLPISISFGSSLETKVSFYYKNKWNEFNNEQSFKNHIDIMLREERINKIFG